MAPPFPKTTLLFLLLLLGLLPSNVNSPTAERIILLNLKEQWGNPPLIQSWNSTSSPCSWPEIQCSGNGTATGIFLPEKKINGEIPKSICDLENLSFLDLSLNYIPGNFPTVLYNCSKLQHLDLSQNNFVGPIPADIDRLPALQYLNLGANNFTGNVPPAIGNLPELQTLYLFQNLLNGTFPAEIGNLSNLEELGMAYENSFSNNPNLPATNSISNLPNCYAKIRDSNHLSSKILAMILVLAVAVFIVTISFTFFVIRDYRRKKHRRDIATWKLTSLQRLDFTEVNILSSLTENNMIGSGGSGEVYRISVNRSGEYVAVKRIWSNKKLHHTLEKEFLAEIEILGTIRHSNIVKLLCCISSEDSKLLVYEFMENQSLDRWLHGKKRKMPSLVNSSDHRVALDWPARLRIAIGAAQGLAYMHHDCFPPIVHRDVKSSNILLDSEFKARIADFGLAKILVKQGEPNTMSAIAGSFGYLAPEYAYTTKVNEKTDVYSFGVVLLELVTGREASDGDEHTSLAEWAWKHYGEDKLTTDALDEEIKEPCHLEEMTTVFKLGVICTCTLPSNRPSMKEVLQILHRCNLVEGDEGKKAGHEYDVAPLLSGDGDKYLYSYRRTSKVSWR